MRELHYTKGFDVHYFIEYLKDTHELNAYGIETIKYIIDYAHEHKNLSRDMFADFVSDLLPYVDFKEVAAFCEDDILTEYGREMKKKFWDEYNICYFVSLKNINNHIIDKTFDDESAAIACFEEYKKMYKDDEYVKEVILNRYIDDEWDSEYNKVFYC